MSPRLLSYLSLAFAFAATPGATTALVVHHTLAGGRRRGLRAALGAMLANLTQTALAVAGVGALIVHWPAGLSVLRAAGALFLVWIGVRSLRSAMRPPAHAGAPDSAAASRAGTAEPSRDDSGSLPRSPFRDGFSINVMNPSITSFYAGVAPNFLPAHPTWRSLLALCLMHVAIAFGCHLLWASIFDRARALFTQARPRRILDAAVGLLLLALAARILLA